MKQKVKNQPVYLGFASQKGGVGKSSLAEILASILYYEKGISLLVVDCDGTQESFFKLRQRERRVIEGSETISKQMKDFFTKFGKHAYPIIRSTPKNVIKYVNEYISLREQLQTYFHSLSLDNALRDTLPTSNGSKKALSLLLS